MANQTSKPTAPISVRSGSTLTSRVARLEELVSHTTECPPLLILWCRARSGEHPTPTDAERMARCASSSTLLPACVAYCRVCFPNGDRHAA
jgi:hypothetical protein